MQNAEFQSPKPDISRRKNISDLISQGMH